MIIWGDERLPVGAIYRGVLTDTRSRPHFGMTWQVLREATGAEYLAYVEREIGHVTESNRRLAVKAGVYFYEVSVD